MHRCWAPALVALAALCLAASPALAARLALVVGNDHYADRRIPQLRNARNDAQAVAREFEAAGFKTVTLLDASRTQMHQAFEDLLRRIKPGEEVAYYFSGHGAQPQRTGPMLLPVDLQVSSERAVERDGVPLELVVQELSAVARLTLVIVDACRDDPLRQTRPGRTLVVGSTLTAVEAPVGTLILMSATRGQQALDSLGSNDPVPNGLFTRELVRQMRVPGLSVSQMARRVRDSVDVAARRVNHAQRPALNEDVSGEFYLHPPAGRVAAAAPHVLVPLARPSPAPVTAAPAALKPAPSGGLVLAPALAAAASTPKPSALMPLPDLFALQRAAAEPGAVRLPSGLVFRPLTAGQGARPAAGDLVWVRYRTTLADGRAVENDALAAATRLLPLARATACWQEALPRMQVQGKARFSCPAALAYGAQGAAGVPPHASLRYDVELMGILSKAR